MSTTMTADQLIARLAELDKLEQQAEAINARINAIVGECTAATGSPEYRNYLLRRHEARKGLMS